MGKNCFSTDDVIQSNLPDAKKIKRFISHTIDSRWTKLTVSNTALKKLLNHSEFLFSFLFSFHKMAPNGAVSHEIVCLVEVSIEIYWIFKQPYLQIYQSESIETFQTKCEWHFVNNYCKLLLSWKHFWSQSLLMILMKRVWDQPCYSNDKTFLAVSFYHLVFPILKILFDSNKLLLSLNPYHKILYKGLARECYVDDQLFVSISCTSTLHNMYEVSIASGK